MILSFPCNFFVCFKFLSDLGRVIGKIKQNEQACRDTAPLSYKYVNRLKRTGKLLTAQMLPGLYLCVSTKFQLDLNGIDRKV